MYVKQVHAVFSTTPQTMEPSDSIKRVIHSLQIVSQIQNDISTQVSPIAQDFIDQRLAAFLKQFAKYLFIHSLLPGSHGA